MRTKAMRLRFGFQKQGLKTTKSKLNFPCKAVKGYYGSRIHYLSKAGPQLLTLPRAQGLKIHTTETWIDDPNFVSPKSYDAF